MHANNYGFKALAASAEGKWRHLSRSSFFLSRRLNRKARWPGMKCSVGAQACSMESLELLAVEGGDGYGTCGFPDGSFRLRFATDDSQGRPSK